MHEMSIVTGVLEIVQREAKAAEASVIRKVELDVGDLAGVEVPALQFCFEAARRGTMAERASLVIHRIPGRGRCPECNKEVAIDAWTLLCPGCGDGVLEILQGKELRVRSLDVD